MSESDSTSSNGSDGMVIMFSSLSELLSLALSLSLYLALSRALSR